jgi:hypothetical protein
VRKNGRRTDEHRTKRLRACQPATLTVSVPELSAKLL